MMETTITEIAAVLRSTEAMAEQFVKRVQERVNEQVPPIVVLSAMQKISIKTLTLEKVVTKVQEIQKKELLKAQRQQAKREKRRSAAAKSTPVAKTTANATTTAQTSSRQPAPAPRARSTKEPKTILEKLQAILERNWDRAAAEGLSPDRMSAKDFMNAVYGYTDRREASRRRILKAAARLDESDVLLTPALVADDVHELFEAGWSGE
jgi:aspartokinase